MENSNSRSDSPPDKTDAESSTGDARENQSDERAAASPLSRRATLASVLGIGGLGLVGGTAHGRGPRPWKQDVDAQGNRLLNLGALTMQANQTEIADFEGTGLAIDSNNVLNVTVTDTDTQTAVSDNGTQVTENAKDIDFGPNLTVTDDGGGDVTVEEGAPWEDSDDDGLLEAPGFDGIEINDSKVMDSSGSLTLQSSSGNPLQLNTDGGTRALQLGVPGTDQDGYTAGANVVGGHPTNSADDAVGATIGGGGSSGKSRIIGGGTFKNWNKVLDNYGTIAGGKNNRAGADDDDPTDARAPTVGGGFGNRARGPESTVSGGFGNKAFGDGSFIGGGASHVTRKERSTIAGGSNNTATGTLSTIAGGLNNNAEDFATTVAGGSSSEATGRVSTVGGGESNNASAEGATVPGGRSNVVSGKYGFAAGAWTKVADDDTFVWNDSSDYHQFSRSTPNRDGGLDSSKDIAGSGVTGENTFHASAQNGFRFLTGPDKVTYISGGSTAWSTTSTRAATTNIAPVQPEQVLAGVEAMEVATWEYKDEDGDGQGVRHIGPMAEDFHEAVDVGNSDEHINSINADGVLFAAVQGLSAELDDKDDRIDELEAENEALHERLDALEDRLDSLEDG